ncbi:mitochondrial aspartyl-tRNA synthetase [Powellomyces hirtus]|nr:mitochondrial aspartyl-tRNA synthetase [Powellomyces hirtus]
MLRLQNGSVRSVGNLLRRWPNGRSYTCRTSRYFATPFICQGLVSDLVPADISRGKRSYSAGATNAWSNEFNTTSGKKRTHKCGDLRLSDVGKEVVLCGWALNPRKAGTEISFIPIRDHAGTTQLVHEVAVDLADSMHLRDNILAVTPESIVCAKGIVRARPSEAVNREQATGEVEVALTEFQVLNPAEGLPFSTAPRAKLPSEETRLKYRYVDLRRAHLQENLRKRSLAAHTVRNYLHDQGFTEVETPLLFKSTPEGAREFLVPTRQKGQFYALPQSPQQYKQVLMSAGIDRYYQIAKCFRDESLASDRQPEFTQIDVEMSFVDMEDVMKMMEGLVKRIWKDVAGFELRDTFPRMTYEEAMGRFGSDKPDTRFGLEICDITDIIGSGDAEEGIAVEVFKIPNGANLLSNKEVEKVKDIILKEEFPLLGGKINPADLIFLRVPSDLNQDWTAKLKFIKSPMPRHQKGIATALGGVQPGDLLVVSRRVAGYLGPHTIAGRARLLISKVLAAAKHLELDDKLNFLWVHSFPLFSPTEFPPVPNKSALFESTHHPFTAPTPSSLSEMPHSPGSVLGQHYDLVLNGQEIGGGSIRVHDPKLQRYIFSQILRMSEERIQSDFGHLLDALQYGCPPHGGMALGLDRLMAILCGTNSIRDVIAFPKLSGGDLFVESPAEVGEKSLKEYHLKVLDQ